MGWYVFWSGKKKKKLQFDWEIFSHLPYSADKEKFILVFEEQNGKYIYVPKVKG